MEREWYGLELQARINRAAGRAIIGIAMAVAVETKNITHVVNGNLRRSIHAAEVGYDGSPDEEEAQSADLLMSHFMPVATPTPFGPAVEVGSWMPYACVEWVGRGHPGITQGLESVRGIRTDVIVRRAFQEEGLI